MKPMKNINIKTIIFILIFTLIIPVISACAETEETPALTGNISDTQTPNEQQYLSETPVKIDSFPDNDDIYIGYTVNSKRAGRIKGGAIRKLSDEEKQVEAIPNFGYKFVRWSDGNTSRTRSDSLKNIKDSVLTAIFDYDVLDMPIITIDTKPVMMLSQNRLYRCEIRDLRIRRIRHAAAGYRNPRPRQQYLSYENHIR